MRLQEWIHKFEVGEGTKWIRLSLAVLGFLALAAVYDLRESKNFSTQEAMDAAQLARNIARGEGYTTDFVRPFSLYLVEKHQTERGRRTNDFSVIKSGHPDLANPPVYPVVLAGAMKVLPFDYFIPQGVIFRRYQPEVLISFLNQGLFFLAVVMVFRLARRLFDASVAWVSTIIFAGAELFWRFSVSGLSTMLLVIIFLGLVWCLVFMEDAHRESRRGGGWFLGMAVVSGVLIGAGALTRYAFGWLILPVLAFFAIYFGRRRAVLCVSALLAFAAVLAPWLVRNNQWSGALFGTAGYALVQETAEFSGDRLERSLKPDLSAIAFEDYLRKLVVNVGSMVQSELPKLGGSWVSAFFLVGLMVRFVRPALGRLRVFLLLTLGVWVIVSALGRTRLSNESPDVNSENLMVVLAPLVFIYGAGMYFTLLDQLNLPFQQLRHLVTAAFLLLACAPMILTLLPPRTHPVAFPPYYPPLIERFAGWMQERELVMSDMPWAVAWYGNRQCVWTTLYVQDAKRRDDFYAINDFQKPVQALYLTQLTTEGKLHSQMLAADELSWGRFILNGLVKTNLPSGFPLKHAGSGYLSNGQLFLTDRQRWKGRAE
jgi:dolichyl-phosphate-mannose-protein mannosyltransferase